MTCAPALSRAAVVGVALLATVLSACAAEDDDQPNAAGTSKGGETSAAVDPCAVDQLNLVTPGTLTIGTDSPAYPPWFTNMDPSNGKGFEGAVASAVAKEMGFRPDQVRWTTVPFNKSYAPGDKNFDFDINEISITPQRDRVVDFSDGYYEAAQAVVVLEGSEYADAATVDELKDAKFGVQVGTTSLSAVQNVIQPSQQIYIYEDTNGAKQALINDQVDAIVADLPTAFFITGAEIDNSTIVGQFQPTTGKVDEFGLLFEEGNPLVSCANKALTELRDSGRLDQIEQRWLSQVVDVPELD